MLTNAFLSACIGPVTAQTAVDLGFSVACVAEAYTIDGLIKALIEHASSVDKGHGAGRPSQKIIIYTSTCGGLQHGPRMGPRCRRMLSTVNTISILWTPR